MGFAGVLLLAGCSHSAGAPAPPPAPALAPVTFIWTPAPDPCGLMATPCVTTQTLTCIGGQAIAMDLGISSKTLTLPPGDELCVLTETVDVQGIRFPMFDVTWAGAIRPGAQTIALRLPTG